MNCANGSRSDIAASNGSTQTSSEWRVLLRPSIQERAPIDGGDRATRRARDERFAIQEVDDARRVSRIDAGPLRELAQANRRPEVAEGPKQAAGLGALE
jgi:hypothetical protein